MRILNNKQNLVDLPLDVYANCRLIGVAATIFHAHSYENILHHILVFMIKGYIWD